MTIGGRRVQSLRYGENPHQSAFLAIADRRSPFHAIDQLHGKELSFNNILDLAMVYELLNEFQGKKHFAAIVKHQNPCGAALAAGPAAGLSERFRRRSALGLRRHRRLQPPPRGRDRRRHGRDLFRGHRRPRFHRRGPEDPAQEKKPAPDPHAGRLRGKSRFQDHPRRLRLPEPGQPGLRRRSLRTQGREAPGQKRKGRRGVRLEDHQVS